MAVLVGAAAGAAVALVGAFVSLLAAGRDESRPTPEGARHD